MHLPSGCIGVESKLVGLAVWTRVAVIGFDDTII